MPFFCYLFFLFAFFFDFLCCGGEAHKRFIASLNGIGACSCPFFLGALVMVEKDAIDKFRTLIPKEDWARNFLIARAIAIQFYSQYEQTLVTLYAHLMGVDPRITGFTFFQIRIARARLAVLEKLLKKRHGKQYNIFWNSLSGKLNELDARRNNIVHWATAHNIGNGPSFLTLVPPNFWDRDENTPFITEEGLYEFGIECDFYSRLINMFFLSLRGEVLPPAWPDIFQQPIVYPPPAEHPLWRKKPKPDSQPLPSDP